MELSRDLFNIERFITPKGIGDERKALLQELVDATGYSIGRILDKTKGMQTVADLRFILSAMRGVRGAKDGKHAFNIVLFTPHH